MTRLRVLFSRLAAIFAGSQKDEDLREEIETHLALLSDEFRRRGLSDEDARRAARREFGGAERTREHVRDARSFLWIREVREDLAYAGRVLLRNPGFATASVLTLALGIASVTTTYSVMHDLLHPLPYRGAERLVIIRMQDTQSSWQRGLVTPDEFRDYEQQSDVFEALMATRFDPMKLSTPEGAELVKGGRTTTNFFDVMGVPPLLGRVIQADDARANAPPVVVLRHRTWMTLFGGNPGVIGQTIRLDDKPRTIVGVMPSRFTWQGADLWIPQPLDRSAPGILYGRLKEGVSVAEAAAQMNVIAARRARTHPQDYPEKFQVAVERMIDELVGDFRALLYRALGAVALLMLIACSNVANMLLARSSAQERELTIRAALGAGQARIVRQVFIESLVLALLGAISGYFLAYVGLHLMVPLFPANRVPSEVEFGIHTAVLPFAAALAALSALLFGTAPALYSARRSLLAEGLRRDAATLVSVRNPLASSLVIAQIALSLVLLVCAGLLIRSFVSLAKTDLGFDPSKALVVSLVPKPDTAQDTPAQRRLFYDEVLRRISALPGVEGAAATTGVPPYLDAFNAEVRIPGSPTGGAAFVQFCTPGYFRLLDLQLLRGRDFSAQAGDDAFRTAVVSHNLATALFAEEDPTRKWIELTFPGGPRRAPQRRTLEIVGVVNDVKNQGLRKPPAPQVYLPGVPRQGDAGIIVRTTGNPRLLEKPIYAEIKAAGRYADLEAPETIQASIEQEDLAQTLLAVTVFGVFAATATMLVMVGVFGVLAYTVSRQTREIGLRMALGAGNCQVMWIVLRRGVRFVLTGLAIGLPASAATSRALESQLWRTSPMDPLTLIAAAALIAAVALAACYVPARRAMRVDPLITLRQE